MTKELFPFMNPCHPLTDKMCENISLYMRHKYREWDTYKGAKYSTFNITNELMRVTYDKGCKDRLEEVINAWNQILQDEVGDVWAKGTNEFGINRRRYNLFLENPILAEFDNVLIQMLSQQQQEKS